MAEIDVRVEELPSMRVATFHALGESPEPAAWQKLRAWAEPKGLLDDPARHPVFGFNNPQPSPDRKEYGYELWIAADPEAGVEAKDFKGGLFAVTTCRRLADIGDTYRQLWEWIQSSPKYNWRKTHELERVHDPRASEQDIVLDLCVPVELITARSP